MAPNFRGIAVLVYMKSFFRLISTVILFVASAGAKAGLEEGVDAYNSGNYSAAIKEFMPLAAKGNATAQYSGPRFSDSKLRW